MRTTKLMVTVGVLGLGLALSLPIQAEWEVEGRRTYTADVKSIKHPCCVATAAALLPEDTAVELCPYYVNNLKKKNRGSVVAMVGVIALESQEILLEWFSFGQVRDNHWGECFSLDLPGENIWVVAEFSLDGLPRLKQKRKHTDAFTAGLLVIPSQQLASASVSQQLNESLWQQIKALPD